MQRRRRDFFRGSLRPLKGYHAAPAGGSRGEGPPDGSEVSFFKRFKVLETCGMFLAKNPFFSKKIFEKMSRVYKNF